MSASRNLNSCIFKLCQPDAQLFRVKLVSNNNSLLATLLSFHVSLTLCRRLIFVGKNYIQSGFKWWRWLNLSRHNVMASKVVMLLAKLDKSSTLWLVQILNMYPSALWCLRFRKQPRVRCKSLWTCVSTKGRLKHSLMSQSQQDSCHSRNSRVRVIWSFGPLFITASVALPCFHLCWIVGWERHYSAACRTAPICIFHWFSFLYEYLISWEAVSPCECVFASFYEHT